MSLKKNFLILISVLLCSLNTQAQDFAVSEGDWLVDVGFGFGRTHQLYGGHNWSSNIGMKTPTFSTVVQKAFSDDISIGAFIAYDIYGGSGTDYYQNNFGTSWEVNERSFLTGLRGEYHFNKLIGLESNLDLYAGAVLGMRIWKNEATWNYNGSSLGQQTETNKGNNLETGIFAGARYYFTDGIAAFGELGFAITALRLGIAFKL